MTDTSDYPKFLSILISQGQPDIKGPEVHRAAHVTHETGLPSN